MITLQHEITYRLKVTGPLAATEGSPVGARECWEMAEGTLTGGRTKAKIAMPGGDWMVVSNDHVARLAEPVQQNHGRTLAADRTTLLSCAEPVSVVRYPTGVIASPVSKRAGASQYRSDPVL
jgi:hypothetical protein